MVCVWDGGWMERRLKHLRVYDGGGRGCVHTCVVGVVGIRCTLGPLVSSPAAPPHMIPTNKQHHRAARKPPYRPRTPPIPHTPSCPMLPRRATAPARPPHLPFRSPAPSPHLPSHTRLSPAAAVNRPGVLTPWLDVAARCSWVVTTTLPNPGESVRGARYVCVCVCVGSSRRGEGRGRGGRREGNAQRKIRLEGHESSTKVINTGTQLRTILLRR